MCVRNSLGYQDFHLMWLFGFGKDNAVTRAQIAFHLDKEIGIIVQWHDVSLHIACCNFSSLLSCRS